MTDGAQRVLKEGYLRMRGEGREHNITSVTPRILDSLIRISTGVAKLRLHNNITESDASYATDLVFNSVKGISMDENGICDSRILSSGIRSKEVEMIDNVRNLYNILQKRTLTIDDVINYHHYDKQDVINVFQKMKDVEMIRETEYGNGKYRWLG